MTRASLQRVLVGAQCCILTSVKPLWLDGKERPKCGSRVTQAGARVTTQAGAALRMHWTS